MKENSKFTLTEYYTKNYLKSDQHNACNIGTFAA